MAFAVIKTGGKQYLVEEGDTIRIEKLSTLNKPVLAGETVSFDQVLMVDDGKNILLGTPTVSGAKVEATLVREFRDKKVLVVKFKNKTRHRLKRGHRQNLAVVKIEKIKA